MLFLAFTSADIIFHNILELHSTLTDKKIFVANFPFLTDSLTHPLISTFFKKKILKFVTMQRASNLKLGS